MQLGQGRVERLPGQPAHRRCSTHPGQGAGQPDGCQRGVLADERPEQREDIAGGHQHRPCEQSAIAGPGAKLAPDGPEQPEDGPAGARHGQGAERRFGEHRQIVPRYGHQHAEDVPEVACLRQASQQSALVSAQNSVNSANASLQQSKASLESTRAQQQASVQTAQNSVDQQQASLGTAQATYEIHGSRRLRLRSTRPNPRPSSSDKASSRRNSTSTAPRWAACPDGIVQSINGTPGQWVTGGSSNTSTASSSTSASAVTSSGSIYPSAGFIVLSDVSTPQVTPQVSEADVGRIKPGQPISFTLAAYAGRTFTGRL